MGTIVMKYVIILDLYKIVYFSQDRGLKIQHYFVACVCVCVCVYVCVFYIPAQVIALKTLKLTYLRKIY